MLQEYILRKIDQKRKFSAILFGPDSIKYKKTFQVLFILFQFVKEKKFKTNLLPCGYTFERQFN